MHIYIPDMAAFFAFLDAAGHRYVVLRSFRDYPDAFPKPGEKGDVDLLVDDAAFEPILTRYKRTNKRKGIDCDICTVSGLEDGAPYFPPAMAERILQHRERWKDAFYVPSPSDHFASLIFMLAYYKRELSGIDAINAAIGTRSKYHAELARLAHELHIDIPTTLRAFHEFLKARGDGITSDILSHRVQAEFRRERDSDFLIGIAREEGYVLPELKEKGLFSFLRKKKV